MKKFIPFLIVFAVMISILFTFGQAAKKGPIVDTILVDVRMQEDVGMKDAAEGKTDIFFWGVQGRTYKALPDDVKAKLDVYRIPSGSWSININSYPHKAPYVANVGGKDQFNPFAIQKVRFALNWLINRKYIIDEILGGDGQPMFTMATPGQPGTYRYGLIAAKLGMTATGNEKKAIEDINAALTEASNLPELKGKLVKKDNFWYFNNEPVTVKFLIRVDDPNGRLRSGRYIADQIEKAGIKVERLEWDRKKAISTSYYTDPKEMQWHLYTEGWGAGSTRKWWEGTIAQMYAPWYGYMPGGADPAKWNYEQKEIDDLTKKLVNGQFLTEQEYWDMALKAVELGLKEAMRIYICSQEQYYVVNKDRFVDRMAYGVGDGMNHWSLRTADVKPEKDGSKVLRMTEFSAKGALFMSAWDPIGVDGFADVYSRVLMEPMRDFGSFESPYSADMMPWRVQWDLNKLQTKGTIDKDGKLVGQIPVPANAIWYNSKTKKWEPVAKGTNSFATCTYKFVFSKYHNGHQQRLVDVLYAIAFSVEWANKDGDNDKYYDDQYSSQVKPGLDIIKGIVINNDGTITTYYDYNWPMEKARVASAGAFWVPLTPWPIYEAM
ncbi:MAG: ABC transporter substrate-binding protein, partial [Spirochaetes bacterium]|nr:ABC transporter substrate-binding protein [Spirochaetota bacterium]